MVSVGLDRLKDLIGEVADWVVYLGCDQVDLLHRTQKSTQLSQSVVKSVPDGHIDSCVPAVEQDQFPDWVVLQAVHAQGMQRINNREIVNNSLLVLQLLRVDVIEDGGRCHDCVVNATR